MATPAKKHTRHTPTLVYVWCVRKNYVDGICYNGVVYNAARTFNGVLRVDCRLAANPDKLFIVPREVLGVFQKAPDLVLFEAVFETWD
jgi:hypothetical protein